VDPLTLEAAAIGPLGASKWILEPPPIGPLDLRPQGHWTLGPLLEPAVIGWTFDSLLDPRTLESGLVRIGRRVGIPVFSMLGSGS
jgi:hypothetical protein